MLEVQKCTVGGKQLEMSAKYGEEEWKDRDKIKMSGKCSKKGKCDRDKYRPDVMMQVGSCSISCSVQD